ncbi:MAG: AbrB/MazE/SpoVT family DNA-binding domain-containing protein [archaeon]
MERKLIRLANKTLVVSLPSDWLEHLKLKKGDSVDIIRKEKDLLIRPQERTDKNLTLDIKNFPDRFLRKRLLASAYKIGFRRLTLKCTKAQIPLVEGSMDMCLGLIVLEKTNDKIVIENIAEAESHDFESIFNKAFHILLFKSQELARLAKANDRKGLEELIEQRYTLRRHTNLCIYFLNQSGHGGLEETNSYFYLLSTLDAIGDAYVRMTRYALKKKMSKEELAMLVDTNAFLKEVYLFFMGKAEIKNVYEIREKLVKLRQAKMEGEIRTLLILSAKLMREVIECTFMIKLLKQQYILPFAPDT